jgi:hypothetical protein
VPHTRVRHACRGALDQTSWDAATELINSWTAAGEIGVVKIDAPTIHEAVRKFFEDCEARKLGWEAMRKYRHLLEDRFNPWAERSGLTKPAHLGRFTPAISAILD